MRQRSAGALARARTPTCSFFFDKRNGERAARSINTSMNLKQHRPHCDLITHRRGEGGGAGGKGCPSNFLLIFSVAVFFSVPDPCGTFGFRTFPMPRFEYTTSRARSLSIIMNSLKTSVRPFLLHSPWFVTMFCTRPSPSSMRSGLVNTVTCLHHQKPVWLLPVVLFSTDCGPPIVTSFSPRDPPNEVFRRETVAIRTQVGHRDSSLSSKWRDDASQVVRASDHDFLHNAQLSCLILCYLLEGFFYSVKGPLCGLYFNPEK